MEAEKQALYEDDVFVWTQRTAALLRAGRFDEVDVEYLAAAVGFHGQRRPTEYALTTA